MSNKEETCLDVENIPTEYPGVAFINNRFIFQDKMGRNVSTEEIVAVNQFKGDVVRVRRGYGLTLNLGNYESAKLEVSIDMPCYPEDVDACDEWCRQWVEKRVIKEVSNVRGEK